jgi:hypothetical protein
MEYRALPQIYNKLLDQKKGSLETLNDDQCGCSPMQFMMLIFSFCAFLYPSKSNPPQNLDIN